MSINGHICVDFDGTLVTCGMGGTQPIVLMVERVKKWLANGIEVKICTARAFDPRPGDLEEVEYFCLKYFGKRLEITCSKDYNMLEIWDDRAIQVRPNTGVTLEEEIANLKMQVAQLKNQYDECVYELLLWQSVKTRQN